jgi:hypothetical protein
MELPTAMQVVLDVQLTPFRTVVEWGGSGIDSTDHDVPFHTSARASDRWWRK